MFSPISARSTSRTRLLLQLTCLLYLSYSLLVIVNAAATTATTSSSSSSATISDCAPNISEPHVPLHRLGGVPNLSRECEQALTPLLHDCHRQYFEVVRDAFVAAKCYEGSESFRRAACCRLWQAKECMVQAAASRVECEAGNTTEHFRNGLPSEAGGEREHLMDRCSEYGEGVAACELDEDQLHASFSFGVFVTVLLVFISLPAVAFGLMKAREFYLDYKKFKQGEEESNIVRLDAVDGMGKNGSISLPLTEKMADYHDDDDNDDDDADDDSGEELPKKELPVD